MMMDYARFTRRELLRTAAALPLLSLVPGIVRAGTVPRKFLFLFAAGGWDTTLVFDRSDAANASDALRWTSSPARPGVDRFFRRWGHRTAIVNGMHMGGIGHTAATHLLLTGDVAPGQPDWPTLLGRTPGPVPIQVPTEDSFSATLGMAVGQLRTGASRSETIRIPGVWDTHFDNTPQSPQFDSFFNTLDGLFGQLSQTPGDFAARLLDEIVVVVVSEFGREPRHNEAGGKHHWPVTSAMISGPGISGGRVIGATDAGLAARPVDFRTGLPARGGSLIQAENLGAALLRIGGLSPAEYLPDVQVLHALLA